MKTITKYWKTILSAAAMAAVIILLFQSYLRFVSQKIYEENSALLTEVYALVNRNLSDFMNECWGNLDDWSHHIQIEDDPGVYQYLEGRRNYWNFSSFYFLSADGSYMTQDGETGRMVLERAGDRLFNNGENVMFSSVLADGQAITLFAIPIQKAAYRGFEYQAIAMSYTNSDIVTAFSTQAFEGESRCFVVKGDGSVVLSSYAGGSVFSNYLTYLRMGSDLSAEELDAMQAAWRGGERKVLLPTVGGKRYYLVCLPVRYEDCVLLGMVPEAAVGTSTLDIQRATQNVMIQIFLILGTSLIAWIVYRYRKTNRKSVIALKYRDLMFEALSRNVDEVFLLVDNCSWNVDYVSPNIERLLGIPLREAQEGLDSLAACVPNGTAIDKEGLADIPLGSGRHYECECVRRGDGDLLWYHIFICHEQLQGTGKYIIVMSDRTRERMLTQRLETALEIAEKANKSKSDFLSNMSHDIRTPMNAIIGFNVLLARHSGSPERVVEYTKKIASASQHLLYLINDILDMSKIESGKTNLNIEEFDLPRLLDELYSMLLPQARAKRQSLTINVQGRPAERLLGDRLKVNQILINLISNAIKYTPAEGTINLLVAELPQLSPQYARMQFVVTDNGIGMSQEFLERIFDAFSREENSTISGIQGTGLGMAITKSLVELMGGTIDVESVQGQGSKFTLNLVFNLAKAADHEEFWRHYGICRILAVDDEEDICLEIQEMMNDVGVKVSYATNGRDALKMAEKSVECGEKFQVILLDWKMPGWSGIETARHLREQLGDDIPILAFTAYDWADIEEEAREAGITAFLSKPFFISSFRQILERLHPASSDLTGEINAAADGSLEGMKFLVAEDNEINAEILEELLKMEGADIALARDGQEVLDMFLISQEGDYDMILMDVQMPVMDGYEATKAIRTSGHPMAKKMPIVAMTANAFTEDVRNAMEAGMDGHLAKPVNLDTMISLIQHICQKNTKNASEES